MEKVEANRKPRERYPKDFKIKVLKDMYENNLSHSFTVKKYGISCQEVLKYWIRQFSLDSKSLSLSQKVIDRVKAMEEKKHKAEPEVAPKSELDKAREEIENLRKALQYSELRNEALMEVINIGKKEYGLDLLKKPGAKQ